MSFSEFQAEFDRDPAYAELMDCGKRISDTFALHRLADPIGNLGKFFAVKLSDGRTNNNLYPSAEAAREDIGRRDDENRWMYVQVIPSTLSARDAAITLRTHRKMHDKGLRISSMNGRTMIPRLSREDHMAQLRSMFQGSRPTNITHRKGG